MALSRTLSAVAAVALIGGAPLAAVATAQAQTVTVTGRDWIQQVSGFAGMGVAAAGIPCTEDMDVCNVIGSLGSSALQTGLAPATVVLPGSVAAFDSDGQFTATFNAAWDLRASYGLVQQGTDAVLEVSTQHESIMETAVTWSAGEPVVTDVFNSLNFQRVTFTLDAPAAFTIAGAVWGEYNPILLRRDDGMGGYQNIGLGGAITSESGAWFDAHPGDTWEFMGTGTLAAGTYWIENFTLPSSDSVAGQTWAFGQHYRLTLHDTVAAPVPEPHTVALMAIGLSVLLIARRRRAGTSR